MGILGEKLKAAIDKKKSDINTFVWKDKKVHDINGKTKQLEIKLVDMSESKLRECYEHCKTMLFNTDVLNQGRYVVLGLISDQKDRCGAELFLRLIEEKTEMSRFTLLNSTNEFLVKNKEAFKGYRPAIGDMFSGVEDEFKKIPLDMVIDGCLDRLGTFDKRHITRSFILRQGIWLTPSESKDLAEVDEKGKIKDRLVVVRERLNIRDTEKLRINSKGLNYTQLRSTLNLKPNKKYFDLTTSQLETLRYRVLFNLEEVVRIHISSWERIMEEIEMVAESKGFKL